MTAVSRPTSSRTSSIQFRHLHVEDQQVGLLFQRPPSTASKPFAHSASIAMPGSCSRYSARPCAGDSSSTMAMRKLSSGRRLRVRQNGDTEPCVLPVRMEMRVASRSDVSKARTDVCDSHTRARSAAIGIKGVIDRHGYAITLARHADSDVTAIHQCGDTVAHSILGEGCRSSRASARSASGATEISARSRSPGTARARWSGTVARASLISIGMRDTVIRPAGCRGKSRRVPNTCDERPRVDSGSRR